jgi:8-oxo-dGTP pyrophosphatase MutT (NUDIX family)
MQAGGKIEPAEEPLAALQRELDEELGLRPMLQIGQVLLDPCCEPHEPLVFDPYADPQFRHR